MNINNKTLHDFGNDLRDALAPLEDKYGVTIRFGNISYTEERFTTIAQIFSGIESVPERFSGLDRFVAGWLWPRTKPVRSFHAVASLTAS